MQVLEMLRRLVKTSLKHLLEFMNNSACVVGEEVVSYSVYITHRPEITIYVM